MTKIIAMRFHRNPWERKIENDRTNLEFAGLQDDYDNLINENV